MSLLFIFFFIIIIYGGLNFYLIKKLLWIFSFSIDKFGLGIILTEARIILIVVFVFSASAFLLSHVLSHFFYFENSNFFYEFLEVSGSIWFGFMVYFLFSFLLLDGLFFLMSKTFFIFDYRNNFINLLHQIIFHKKYFYLVASLCVIALWGVGYINAHNIKVMNYHLKLEQKGTNLSPKQITFAIASDIHLGSMIQKSQAKKIVDSLMSQDADAILLLGDIIDGDLSSVLYHKSGEELKKLNARLGVFAISGNHEYLGNIEKNLNFLKQQKITVLRDNCLVVDNSFILVGRDDAHRNRLGLEPRKTLEKILDSCSVQDLPIIVMDHQPVAVSESLQEKVFLHLSGHTHHGQLFPFAFITNRMFILSHGLKKIHDTWLYVSSGAGFWGPPIRTSGRAEIVKITIEII